MCCLPPGATLDDILEKFKWLYGSIESSDTLMQEFYCIAQGKREKVQTFVSPFRKGSKSYKTTASLCCNQGRRSQASERPPISWA